MPSKTPWKLKRQKKLMLKISPGSGAANTREIIKNNGNWVHAHCAQLFAQIREIPFSVSVSASFNMVHWRHNGAHHGKMYQNCSRTAKTQISLRICAGWSWSSLFINTLECPTVIFPNFWIGLYCACVLRFAFAIKGVFAWRCSKYGGLEMK